MIFLCLCFQHASSNAEGDLDQEIVSDESSGLKGLKLDSSNSESILQMLLQGKLVQKNVTKYCDICKKTFNSLRSLTYHQLIHSNVRKHPCDMCSKTFIWPYQLRRHKLSHSRFKRYQCGVCNKTLTNAFKLTKHKLTHTDTKKYYCDICNEACDNWNSLATHILSHSSNKKC